MKIAAIVILYYPNIEEVENNIYQYIDFVDKLIIWQNSPEMISFSHVYDDKIVYMGEGRNEYIAKPLNMAIDYCMKGSYDYLLSMDQDSTWKCFPCFKSYISNCNEKNVVIYAPNVNNVYQKCSSPIEVESVITSGSLYNVSLTNKLGGFREDYKIYWVDGEFCCWARLNGFKIKVLTQCYLKQNFGNETKAIGGFFAANYSPIVYFFLIRNMLWMRREYHNTPSLKCVCYTSLLYVRGIILGDKHKFRKLSMIFKGYIDGVFHSFNKRIKR